MADGGSAIGVVSVSGGCGDELHIKGGPNRRVAARAASNTSCSTIPRRAPLPFVKGPEASQDAICSEFGLGSSDFSSATASL
jgi:hypothetical protein